MTARPTLPLRRRVLQAAASGAASLAANSAGLLGAAAALTAGSSALAPARAQASAPATLRFFWWGGGERHKRTLAAIARFEARHPGIKVRAEYMGFNGYLEKLTMQMVGGTEPDVMQINWAWLSMFSRDGKGFLDLYQHRDQLALDEFSAEDRSLCEVNGKLNGLPPSYSARLLLWNQSSFERAGLAVPGSWDALFAAGPAMRARLGEAAFPLDGEIYDLLLLAQAWVHQRHGQSYLDPLAPRVAMSDAALLDWVQTFRRLTAEHVATPLRYRASLGGADKPTEQQTDWVKGHWAGNYTWDSTLRLRASTLAPGQRLVVGAPLRLPGSASSGVFGRPGMLFSASRNTSHPQAAARFINFLLTDPEATQLLGLVRGLPSARTAAAQAQASGALNPLEQAAWAQIRTLREAGQIPRPNPLFEDARMRKLLRDVFEHVSYDKLGDREAAQRLKDHGQALLKRMA